jgi:hypothetical protein
MFQPFKLLGLGLVNVAAIPFWRKTVTSVMILSFRGNSTISRWCSA